MVEKRARMKSTDTGDALNEKMQVQTQQNEIPGYPE